MAAYVVSVRCQLVHTLPYHLTLTYLSVLSALAKSEASTLLAVKQAAFIRNPDYPGESSGPEIVTIGHNPFQPNLGLASHVVLNSVSIQSVT